MPRLVQGVNDLATAYPDVAAQWHPTRNGTLTPADVAGRSAKKVWWLCDDGHESEAYVHNRTKGIGCSVCSNRYLATGVNDLATLKPDAALQWHPTKNGSLTPEKIRAGSGTKVWWMCDKGHEWQSAPATRKSGNLGCSICHGMTVLVGYNDLATVRPTVAAQWHPTKNGSLTPSKVTAWSQKKVWWLCDKGHEDRTQVNCRRTCAVCLGKRIVEGVNDFASTHPEELEFWDTQNTVKPTEITAWGRTEVLWKCDKGHSWTSPPKRQIARKSKCPYCAGGVRLPKT